MSAPTRPRRLVALATAAAVACGLLAALAPAGPVAAASGTGTGPLGQTLTVSDVDLLDPDGATVTVTGADYDVAGFDLATEGMYLAVCVDKGPLVAPSPCVGGVDVTGEGGSSRWVTNNPYQGTPSVAIAADGSFTTTLDIEASDADVDCLDLPVGQSCKVVTRMDHRSSGDRSQDVKVPITFGEPQTGARLELSPAGGLFTEGQDVVVTGTGYPTTAPGLYVVFGPEPENNTDASMYGNQAFVPSSQIAADGSFTVTLEDVEPVYTGEDDEDYDFTNGGGFVSTMRAHGTPDVNGDWARSEPVTFRARTATESFVTAAHVDFLGEEPTRTELAADTAALNQGSKATYLKTLSTSDAWLAGVVNKLYQDTLGRDGSPADVAYWSDQLRAGWSVARVAASFYASPEYFNGIGGGTNASWIEDLYEKVLLRPAFAGDVTYWVSEVQAKGRGNVALRIYQSPESAGTRVEGLYADLLGRAPSAGDVTYWGGVVVKKGDLALAVNLANSAEYANRAVSRFP
jgi:hypothetical protein